MSENGRNKAAKKNKPNQSHAPTATATTASNYAPSDGTKKPGNFYPAPNPNRREKLWAVLSLHNEKIVNYHLRTVVA